ncbi:MAG: holo-ACP synthase [Acetivibrionales bacterium]
MSIRCGVDIIEIDRIKKSVGEGNNAFRDRVFTDREIEYCELKKNVKYESYAARFAAKEAVSKAFGTGIGQGVSLKDIEILNDEFGKPYVVLHNKCREIFEKINGESISLSLSHCKDYAVAYAVIEVS